MKTSNKILLGIFLTIIILTTTVQLVVYAKYKRGEFTPFKRDQVVQMTSLPIPPVRVINLKWMGNCTILPYYTLKMDIQKDRAKDLKTQTVNDTLIIFGDHQNTDDKQELGNPNNSLLYVYLPPSVQLIGNNCTLRVFGTEDSTAAPSYNISLKDSYLFTNYSGPENGVEYFKQLNINSESSGLDLHKRIVINNLNLQFINSKLNDQSATIRKLTMGADDKSSINLSGKNVNALK